MKPKFFATPPEFGDWLEAHHDSATELLVGFHKTRTGKPSLTWPQSVDEALCHGWIDGVRKSLGETSYTIRFTPRKPTSHWSAINLKRVKELIAQERMRPAGLRAYEKRSEKNSNRSSYEQRKTIELLPAMVAIFRKNRGAWKFFEDEAPPYYRTAAKHWVMTAKKEETREKRLLVLIESSAAGLRIPPLRPWPRKTTG